jgi:Cu(I)/Ag(I) efflux system membrane protein CusA/SilA
MLGGGTGSEIMRRIAGPMIGGMITTLVLTLLLIPVISYLWQRRRLAKLSRKGAPQ